jgi:hypothetical protein
MIRHTTFCIFHFLVLCLAGLAADPWISANDPAVVTNNDCGFVAVAQGRAMIRRSFLAEGDPGIAAHSADRVNSGDVLQTPDGGRMEIVCGVNVVFTVGPASRVKLGGLRQFTDASGKTATRLDVEVLAGDVRAQVRRNEEKPEYVLVAAEGAEVLVSRGDVALTTGGGWLFSTLSGAASGRIRRGKIVGAPFDILPGHAVGGSGDAALTEEASNALRGRLPFSFELASLALPPLPAMGWEQEAP